ncbi:MAG: hypothetical protein AAGD07_16125 [Planctomycetota bacterium]
MNTRSALALIALSLCIAFCGCKPNIELAKPPKPERPDAVNLPVELREWNWVDGRRQGSCAVASSISMMRWHNQMAAADYMRRNFGGGQTESSLKRKLDSMIDAGYPVSYVSTSNGDPHFLEWASKTRRGAVLFFFPRHCVTFCGFSTDDRGREVALLLDNNRVRTFLAIPKDQFLRDWRNKYTGFALTLIGPPIPPPLWQRVVPSQS